ncbi:MAG: NADH-quinone oxidoreductase subunit N [Pseudomonadota bacterium]
MLTQDQFLASLPLLASSALVILVMAAIAVHRCHRTVSLLALTGFAVTLATVPCAAQVGPQALTGLLVVDGHALFYSGLILIAAIACTLLMQQYFTAAGNDHGGNREEAYLLLAISVNGALVLSSSQHMASFFVGLELMSIPMYGLVGYRFRQRHSLESATKYLVLSAAATAFMLFGMALLYAQSGRLDFAGIAALFDSRGALDAWLAQAGMLVLLAGVAFKLSLAPFHAWTADVYEGAPAPVGAFLATVGKIAVMAVLLRLLVMTGLSGESSAADFPDVLAAIAALSILVGNLLALQQQNLKRMLAWSSVAHFGYLLIVLVAGGSLAPVAAGMYLATYCATTLAAFGVLSVLSSAAQERDVDTVHGVRALASRSPLAALTLAVALLSLAGMPLTAGFIGKFHVLAAGAEAARWDLLLLVVVGSALGLWYYLRVVAALYARPETAGAPAPARGAGWITVVLALVAVIVLGLWPQPLIDILSTALISHPG